MKSGRGVDANRLRGAAGLDAGKRGGFWAISCGAAINMYLFYGLGGGWPPIIDRRWTGVDFSVIIAAALVAAWVFLTLGLLRGQPALTSSRNVSSSASA